MAVSSSRSRVAYWVLVGVLVVFGVLGLFTIGAPFLFTGITLALLFPLRDRPKVFWPVLLGVIGFCIGFGLVAPFSCTHSESLTTGDVAGTISPTVCRSLIGITYTSTADGSPPFGPALATGFALGGVFALGGWLIVRARSRA